MPIRSDLALEAADSFINGSKHIEGISVKSYLVGSFKASDISIHTKAAAESVGKPTGRYITLEADCSLDEALQDADKNALALSRELCSMTGGVKSALVVGLGNGEVTPDSLGVRAADGVIATRHLSGQVRQLFDCEVAVIKAGVAGKTGLESLETVKACIEVFRPEVIILIDALACSGVSRLGSAIQLCDSGISPGSGVMNSRAEISLETVGVKCIAIGVPTMADSQELGLMVTPKSIDRIIARSARLISLAINSALHERLTLSEIKLLSE